MQNNLLNEILKTGNARIWTTFVNTISQFKNNKAQKISVEDEAYVALLATDITGNLTTNLTEFYVNAYNAENTQKIQQKIAEKFNKFEQIITNKLPLQISSIRDELEIYLIDRGYAGDNFATASNALFRNLTEQANQFGNGLAETLDNLEQKPIQVTQIEPLLAKQ